MAEIVRAPLLTTPTVRALVRRTIVDYKLFGRNRMRKLLSAVVMAMSMMSVQACSDSTTEVDTTSYFVGTFDLTRIGTAAAPFGALPEVILSETWVIKSDKTWTNSRLRTVPDPATSATATKNETVTNSGTWVEITGVVNGIRLSGTYNTTHSLPPRASGLPFEYDVTPIQANNLIQMRINGQNWEYVKRTQ
jgi:hypothetical protein